MKIVVDTSIIIAVVMNEIHKRQLIVITKGAELIAPSSLHWEIGNAFSAMLRRKRITLESAESALSEYKKIPIQFIEVGLSEALATASQLNIFAYDAYFIECASKSKVALLSLDKGLLKKAKQIGISVREILP